MSKWKKWIVISLSFIIIVFISMWWVIRPTTTALIQGDDWKSVCRGVIALYVNKTGAIQINSAPITYLEKNEGSLEKHLTEKGYNINYYYPEFMDCGYIDENGLLIQLEGRKCGAMYTIWKHE